MRTPYSPLRSRSVLTALAAVSIVALAGCGGDDLGDVTIAEPSESVTSQDAGAAAPDGAGAGDFDTNDTGADVEVTADGKGASDTKESSKPAGSGDADKATAGDGLDAGEDGSSLGEGDGGFVKKETTYGKDQGVTIPAPGDGTTPTSVQFQSGDRAVNVSGATAELCDITDDYVNGRFVKGDYAITVSAEKDAGGLVSVSGDKRFEGVAKNVEVDATKKTFKISGKSADDKMSYAFSGTC